MTGINYQFLQCPWVEAVICECRKKLWRSIQWTRYGHVNSFVNTPRAATPNLSPFLNIRLFKIPLSKEFQIMIAIGVNFSPSTTTPTASSNNQLTTEQVFPCQFTFKSHVAHHQTFCWPSSFHSTLEVFLSSHHGSTNHGRLRCPRLVQNFSSSRRLYNHPDTFIVTLL